MKKYTLLCIACGLIMSCASGPQDQRKTMSSLSDKVTAGPNQSEILVQYSSSLFYTAEGHVNVFVDGEMVAQVSADTSERIIVTNGHHVILLRQPGKRKINISKKIDVKSQRTIFKVKPGVFTLGLRKEREIALAGIGTATAAIGKSLIDKLPKDASIAVINISTNKQDDAKFVIGELEHALLNSNKYKIVDRNRLDEVRKEQRFQLSGDVSDESAVSIGQMSGATIVITGDIASIEANKTLSIKALDVRTGEIITMEREHY